MCLLALTIFLTLATVPNVRAQTTSITNLQAPSTAAVGRGVHITFNVTYSTGYGGAGIGIGIADADTPGGTWVTGSIYASNPNDCTQPNVNSAYCSFDLSSNTVGSVNVDFVFNPETPRTYHLKAGAFVVDSSGNQFRESISVSQLFSITVTISSQMVVTISFSPFQGGGSVDVAQQNLGFEIDGVNYTTTLRESQLVSVSPGQHTVEVPMLYPLKEDVQAVFIGWEEELGSQLVHKFVSNTIEIDVPGGLSGALLALTADYNIQYFLNLTSPFGSVSGEGWYNASSTAHISVEPDQFRSEGILGLLGAKTNFVNWQGDITVMPASGEIVMNSPHVLQALWQTDLSSVYLSAGALGVFLLVLSIAGAYRVKKKQVILDFSWLRDYMEKHGPVAIQDIRCPYCGGSVHLPDRGTSTMCTYCGRTLLVKQIFDLVKDAIDRA